MKGCLSLYASHVMDWQPIKLLSCKINIPSGSAEHLVKPSGELIWNQHNNFQTKIWFETVLSKKIQIPECSLLSALTRSSAAVTVPSNGLLWFKVFIFIFQGDSYMSSLMILGFWSQCPGWSWQLVSVINCRPMVVNERLAVTYTRQDKLPTHQPKLLTHWVLQPIFLIQ